MLAAPIVEPQAVSIELTTEAPLEEPRPTVPKTALMGPIGEPWPTGEDEARADATDAVQAASAGSKWVVLASRSP